MFDVIVEFPKMKVGVATREDRVVEIRYLPLVVPCHRVVAANGIGGFAHSTEGFLIEAKRWLLAHEIGADAFQLTP